MDLKTFVYVEDRDNPANTKGLKVGYMEDNGEGEGTMEVFGAVFGRTDVKVAECVVSSSGKVFITWEGSAEEEACRLETEPFPAPEVKPEEEQVAKKESLD